MTHEEAKAIAMKAISECRFDVNIHDEGIEDTKFDNDEIDASTVNLFNEKSNDLAYKFVMSL